MNFGDVSGNGWAFVVAGWVHAVAAVAWLGGSAFYALVLRPVFAANPDMARSMSGAIGGAYRELVDASVIALIVSGVILTFNRLTGNTATAAYFIVLGVKLAIAAWMFYAVWRLRRAGYRPEPGKGLARRASWLLGYNAVIALGVLVFLLAGILRALYETAIGS